jgi:hypothetical protein
MLPFAVILPQPCSREMMDGRPARGKHTGLRGVLLVAQGTRVLLGYRSCRAMAMARAEECVTLSLLSSSCHPRRCMTAINSSLPSSLPLWGKKKIIIRGGDKLTPSQTGGCSARGGRWTMGRAERRENVCANAQWLRFTSTPITIPLRLLHASSQSRGTCWRHWEESNYSTLLHGRAAGERGAE